METWRAVLSSPVQQCMSIGNTAREKVYALVAEAGRVCPTDKDNCLQLKFRARKITFVVQCPITTRS